MPDGSYQFLVDEAEMTLRLLPPEAPLPMPPQTLERSRPTWTEWWRVLSLLAAR